MNKFMLNNPWPVPEWARKEREIIDLLDEAAMEFVHRYVNEDGTLIWRQDWPGMDGSDDPNEGFMNLALFYSIGGRDELKELSGKIWDGITWQFTEYGQIYREFDAYYDWMHHGEGYLYFYFMGLSDPYSLKTKQRARKFASLYTGEDKEAQNYDPSRRLIRSPLTGSRGPRFVTTAEDWSTHRGILDNYQAPFEDIPGVDFASGKCAWSDDAVYERIIDLFNARMSRGDVPVNLNATSLITNAFLHTGDNAYRQWVVDYLSEWSERAERNGGILPDNVGLSGAIGEYNDGKWWGGYYGWRWPHGFMTIIEPLMNACMNAVLLTGDRSWLDIARKQVDLNWELGIEEQGRRIVPHKHYDSGWTDYRSPNPAYPIHLWTFSMNEADRNRVNRIDLPDFYRNIELPTVCGGNPVTKKETKHYIANHAPWFNYHQGRNEHYPEQILDTNLGLIRRQIETMRSEASDPELWSLDGFSVGHLSSIHKWQEVCPVYFEGLMQMISGSPMHISHGGLQHMRLRYFDGVKRRPGLPQDVAALVEKIEDKLTVVTLINLSQSETRETIVQGGAYGEHEIDSVRMFEPDGSLIREELVQDNRVSIVLGPEAGVRMEMKMRRFANQPSYHTPWPRDVREIRGRETISKS